MKILLADHNEVNQLITQQMLSQKDIATDCVNNASEIMDRLNADNYALILMDLNMLLNNEDNITQLLAARKNQIPLVAYCEKDVNNSTVSENLLINDIICKPYELSELHKTIARYIPSPGSPQEKETWGEFKKSLYKYADQDEEFASELIDCFIENYQEYKDTARKALVERDQRLLKESWHKISTSNKIFSVSSLDELANELNCQIQLVDTSQDNKLITSLALVCNEIISKLNIVKQNIKS